MTRNTGLTLAQILAELPNAVSCSGGCREPGDGYPRGMLVNEIGQIFEAGGIEGNKAEDELAKLLASKDQAVRYVAYSYLSNSTRRLGAETRSALQVFKLNPENKELVAE